MDINMTETMQAVSEICNTIIKKVDRAYVAECGKKRERPEKLWQLWVDTGLMAMGMPEEYGGLGGNVSDITLAHDLLYRAGLEMPDTNTNFFVRSPILKFGTEEQKQKWLPPSARGEELLAFAITEPDSGTNTFKIRTSAKKQSNGDYVLNGQKCFITAIDESAWTMVVARTAPMDRANRKSGLTLFMVDSKSKGISMDMMDIGLFLPDKSFIVNFDDVVVPAENIIGSEGRGVEALFHCLNPERLYTSAMSVGMADHVLNRAVEYAKVRAPFDAPIGSYQSVQHPLAHAKTQIDAARAMLYGAAAKYDAGHNIGLEANQVKILSSEAFKAAADIAASTFGGSWADLSQDILPFYLKAKMYEIGPINNNIVLCFIAQEALGLPKSY